MIPSQSAEIRNKEYRHGLIAAQIDIDVPLQLRALRKQRGWSQPKLAERTGMKQSRFPLMEKPGGAHFTLQTLRRLAEAFDVALIVRFAPFSELLDWSEHFNPDGFSVPGFDDEFACHKHKNEDIKGFASIVQAPAEGNNPKTLPKDAWKQEVDAMDRRNNLDEIVAHGQDTTDGMALAQGGFLVYDNRVNHHG